MPRRDIAFKASDRVTLRGWFFTPSSSSGKLPCLVMAPGISSNLPVTVLAYDNRCIGASDGEPRREIIPSLQLSDCSDAITFAQTLPESRSHVLTVSDVDRRVKAVINQVPLISGWETFHRVHRSAFIPGLNKLFQNGQLLSSCKGEEPGRLPVVDKDPHALSVLPSEGSFVGYSSGLRSGWINDVTLKRLEAFRAYEPVAFIEHISPTPLLMEPKQWHLLTARHFDPYDGHLYGENVSIQIKFLEDRLLK
ncbi:DltD N-terminal domain protein [Aspergillus transmontanensis]|uniref:DltD N-terminal domain protein n=1 Tax=Aspergillus transmontanensis TaxID=1034304 RepID=A0A5N6VMY2_9EURO|nr:DltD N-terminal domain protein [Aspergillus transmontanensis]